MRSYGIWVDTNPKWLVSLYKEDNLETEAHTWRMPCDDRVMGVQSEEHQGLPATEARKRQGEILP